ncbi:MAG TPA: PA2928 family protein [Ignavibacteria bacterium]
MLKVKSVLILLILSSLYLSGCFFFKKDVMKDTADNVEEAIIMKVNNENYLVTKEEIFQATSKSDKGGFRQTSGYKEYRLTSYDLKTGNVINRVNLEDPDGNYHYFIGPTEGLLWYMSMDKKTGLHARDPKTLEIKISQEDILKVNPDLRNNLPTTKWYELRKYYGYDIQKKIPMISDNSGYIYYLNPKTLIAEKTTKSIKNFNYEESTTSTSMNFDKESHISLSGSPRNHLRIQSKELEEPSFLDGNFLFSSNLLNVADANPDFNSPIMEKREKRQYELDSLTKRLEEFDDNTEKKPWKKSSLKNYIDYVKRDLERFDKESENYTNDRYNSIITPDKSIFIIHQSNASDTSKIVISRIKIKDDGIEQKWDTYVPDIFAEPSKVMSKPGFEYVFSKGSPDFSKKRVLFYDNKLVIILMLRAVCIDAENGKILWDIKL